MTRERRELEDGLADLELGERVEALDEDDGDRSSNEKSDLQSDGS